MSVTSAASSVQYQGNDSTSTPYPVTFEYFDDPDLLRVMVTDEDGAETDLRLTTDFTVDDDGVTTVAAVPTTSTVTIYREVEATQETEFVENGELRESEIVRAFDKLTFLVQQLERRIARTIRVSEASEAPDPLASTGLTNRLFGLDSSGDAALLTGAQVLAILELSGTVFDKPTAFWADDAARASKVPDFTGQVGIQLDGSGLGSFYFSTGTGAGDWESAAIAAGGIGATELATDAVETAKIKAKAVTYDKIQDVAGERLLGNATGSAAAPSEISLGNGLQFTGGALAIKGDVLLKTAGYAVTAADHGKPIIFTTAGATLDLPAASGNEGLTVPVKNAAASGDVTIDPDGSETLDGLASRLLRPGDRVTIVCDGTGWHTIEGEYTFVSANQTLTARTLITVAHGLGVVPTTFRVRLYCQTADLGYSTGDTVEAGSFVSAAGSKGITSRTDATNLYVMPENGIDIANKSTGAGGGITLANWRVILSAAAK